MTETNGHTETAATKKPSALAVLLAELAKTKAKVNASDKTAITAEFKKAQNERQKLVKALADFDQKSDALAVNMVKCYGGTHVMVNGVRYVPTSRGDRVYYKAMSDSPEVVEL